MEKISETPFQLRTLGEVVLADRAGRPARLRTRKSLLLLACLASQPDQTWPRDRLATLFWGDRQDEQAKNSLRTALSDVRRVLGADALVIEGNTVRLAAGTVTTDIERLRELASSDPGTDAGALRSFYGGDFLADAGDAGDGSESVDWIVTLRTACRDLAATVLARSIAGLAKNGSVELAILRARELLSLDPLSEKSHRTLMRLYADSGERSKAVAQFQSCRQMLQRELGVEPSAETSRLADDIAVQSQSARFELRKIATEADRPERIAAPIPVPAAPGDGSAVSIAVLPFVNMSGDADQDYFADGISEDIVTDLSKVPNLSVAAAGSTRLYRSARMRPDEIAAELGVRYILEGSVRRSDKDLRITTSLIEAHSNRQIWAERYDRELVKVFDVQSEIAANVAKAVQLQFSPTTPGQPTARGTSSLEAHEHYLRGRALLREMTRRGIEFSKQSFERAIAIDGNYALAFAGLAESISTLGFHYEIAESLLESAVGYCHTALELDPGLAEAHCSLGRIHNIDLRLEDSEAEFLQAIEISPSLPEAHFHQGMMYLDGGRTGQAIAPLRLAFELASQDLQTGMMLTSCQQALGLTEERRETAERLIGLARRRMSLNPYDDQAAYVGAFALEAGDVPVDVEKLR